MFPLELGFDMDYLYKSTLEEAESKSLKDLERTMMEEERYSDAKQLFEKLSLQYERDQLIKAAEERKVAAAQKLQQAPPRGGDHHP